MKKIVSLLAVALFATIFAAGCGKAKNCSDVTKEEDCPKTSDTNIYEKDSEAAKSGCVWNKTDKKCVAKPSTPATTPYSMTKEDKDVCSGLTMAAGDAFDDANCKKAHDALAANKQISDPAKAGHVCKANSGKTACELATK
jgi:hypothetical protein